MRDGFVVWVEERRQRGTGLWFGFEERCRRGTGLWFGLRSAADAGRVCGLG
jgi:hypothetical protein